MLLMEEKTTAHSSSALAISGDQFKGRCCSSQVLKLVTQLHE